VSMTSSPSATQAVLAPRPARLVGRASRVAGLLLPTRLLLTLALVTPALLALTGCPGSEEPTAAATPSTAAELPAALQATPEPQPPALPSEPKQDPPKPEPPEPGPGPDGADPDDQDPAWDPSRPLDEQGDDDQGGDEPPAPTPPTPPNREADRPPHRLPTPEGALDHFPGIFVFRDERRLEIDGFVCMKQGPALELMGCTRRGKTHESLLLFDCDPQHLQVALFMLDLEPAPQVGAFGQIAYLRHGQKVVLEAEWHAPEGVVRRRVEDLIYDTVREGAMPAVGWVFTGSRHVQVPAPPDWERLETVFAAAYGGNIAAVYHDPDSILDTPLLMGGNDQAFVAYSERLPERGTEITIHVRPWREGDGPEIGSNLPLPPGSPAPASSREVTRSALGVLWVDAEGERCDVEDGSLVIVHDGQPLFAPGELEAAPDPSVHPVWEELSQRVVALRDESRAADGRLWVTLEVNSQYVPWGAYQRVLNELHKVDVFEVEVDLPPYEAPNPGAQGGPPGGEVAGSGESSTPELVVRVALGEDGPRLEVGGQTVEGWEGFRESVAREAESARPEPGAPTELLVRVVAARDVPFSTVQRALDELLDLGIYQVDLTGVEEPDDEGSQEDGRPEDGGSSDGSSSAGGGE
jgi:hypothetical protein